ncbi:MAG: preprotein translocase subunit SecY [bacterium]|nr:preprotein translocase subunit SecY [bacterium]
MNNIFGRFALAFKDKAIVKRIVYTVVGLVIFRLLAAIPIPGVDTLALERMLSGNQFFGLLNIFSGGGLSNLSLVMLGVGPYITGSIIMQLLTMMVPSLKAMQQEDGEAGRARISQYSRILSIPLSFIQAFGFIKLLQSQQVLSALGGFDLLTNILVITAGSVLLMWIGELITEFGIGNGVSLIIFAGIVAVIPAQFGQLFTAYDPSQIPLYIGFIIIALLVIAGVVMVNEAERPVPVTYARQVKGGKTYGGVSTYIPLRLNQAGVIPIIFALSILLFPQMILNFMSRSANATLANIGTVGFDLFNNQLIYGVSYFILVVLFTYFYTAVTFDPKQMSENLQKSGAFLSGIRPGEHTTTFIERIVTRITLVGALFLGIVAVLPLIFQAFTGTRSMAIGGTALLIVVSVVLDLVKKIDAQVSMREY